MNLIVKLGRQPVKYYKCYNNNNNNNLSLYSKTSLNIIHNLFTILKHARLKIL